MTADADFDRGLCQIDRSPLDRPEAGDVVLDHYSRMDWAHHAEPVPLNRSHGALVRGRGVTIVSQVQVSASDPSASWDHPSLDEEAAEPSAEMGIETNAYGRSLTDFDFCSHPLSCVAVILTSTSWPKAAALTDGS